MIIKSAQFINSNTGITKLPKPNLPEYAFVGRSNVGKSSLINMLTGKKKLAKISTTPGKTQLINHFLINDCWYLVDLPGYGFAKASKKDRVKWGQMIDTYLQKRENLQCLFLLIDSRLSPQDNDLNFINRLGEVGIPFVLVFTKSDKSKQQEVAANIATFSQAMLQQWETLPEKFITSAKKGTGRDKILELIDKTNQAF